MKRLELKPDGFPCRLTECPPGFFLYENTPAFKTEYDSAEAFCVSGEVFVAGTVTKEELANIEVQPLVAEWVTE